MDDEARRVSDYRSGYSAGHSHGASGQPMSDLRSARLFFNLTDPPPPARSTPEAPVEPPPPVDRTNRCASDGAPLAADHREIDPATGQQKQYVVLCDAERAKGFVRPVRDTYLHKACRGTTTMGRKLAETYARDPGFYSGTFCATCGSHFPLVEFTWAGTHEQVGS